MRKQAMKAKLTFGFAGAAACVMTAAGAAPLMTPWGEKVTSANCWREYPRPQMVRDNWTCLNGDWDWQVTSVTNTPGRPETWAGKIRVPFAIESALSGVGRALEPDEFLWYMRTITCVPAPGKRILLHFEAVDFRAMVFIGHQEVTDVPHESGQLPFTLDITDYVKPGDNELTVCVWEPTADFSNARAKQCGQPAGCFYTRSSGIVGSVWMETVPEKHIRSYKLYTDIDKGTVRFEFDKVEGAGEVKVSTNLPKDFTCWTPETPQLYTFTATYGEDVVKGISVCGNSKSARTPRACCVSSSTTSPSSCSARLTKAGGRTVCSHRPRKRRWSSTSRRSRIAATT